MVRNSTFMTDEFRSSFLSCEKDMEVILRKLFVDSLPYSNDLKRLLVINEKDCLDPTKTVYSEIINEITLPGLREQGYIKIEPRLELGEHEEVKAYIILEFNNFTSNETNPIYRDCVIDFNIICHTDHWDIGDYRLRPIKIMGYIDGILNNTKLSGIGTLEFIAANEIVLDENLSGYLRRYAAIHGSDDLISES